jgi:hypothetical protein
MRRIKRAAKDAHAHGLILPLQLKIADIDGIAFLDTGLAQCLVDAQGLDQALEAAHGFLVLPSRSSCGALNRLAAHPVAAIVGALDGKGLRGRSPGGTPAFRPRLLAQAQFPAAHRPSTAAGAGSRCQRRDGIGS